MSIIKKYDTLSKENIYKSKVVSDFTENLDEKMELVNNFKYNTNLVYKLMHPFKLVKNIIDNSRLNSIKNEFNEIYDSSIMLYVNEETGNLHDDLEYASRVLKPKFIENYIKNIKLKK